MAASPQPNGGDWASIAVNWLDWQLKGDASAGKWFWAPIAATAGTPAGKWNSTQALMVEESGPCDSGRRLTATHHRPRP
jgi:hypothetical protein